MIAKSTSVPIWGILSVALAPLAEISITVAAIAAEAIVRRPPGVSMSVYIPGITLAAVLWTMGCLGLGLLAAMIALFTREQPRWLAISGLLSTTICIVLFVYVTSVD